MIIDTFVEEVAEKVETPPMGLAPIIDLSKHGIFGAMAKWIKENHTTT